MHKSTLLDKPSQEHWLPTIKSTLTRRPRKKSKICLFNTTEPYLCQIQEDASQRSLVDLVLVPDIRSHTVNQSISGFYRIKRITYLRYELEQAHDDAICRCCVMASRLSEGGQVEFHVAVSRHPLVLHSRGSLRRTDTPGSRLTGSPGNVWVILARLPA